MEESPDDPTQSYAGHSVTTVYVSASQPMSSREADILGQYRDVDRDLEAPSFFMCVMSPSLASDRVGVPASLGNLGQWRRFSLFRGPVLNCLPCSQTDLALFIRKCPNAPATAPSYIQFEMGCKVLSDAAEDNIRISHFIVSTLSPHSGFMCPGTYYCIPTAALS